MKAILVLMCLAGTAAAHDVRGEVLFLDVGDTVVDVELQVPVLQLHLARGAPGTPLAATGRVDQPALRAYAAQHLGATTRDGRAFAIDVRDASRAAVQGHDVVVFRARLVAPAGADARWFALRDDLVLHRVVTDTVYVFLRSDLQTGVLGEAPRLIGDLHWQQRTLVIDRSAGSRARSFATVFRLGMHHIADGTDHLMFLLVLLIPAPLVACGGRWGGRRHPRDSLAATARIVTAFTLGHSLTLLVGTVHGALLPSRVVETLIAASILFTASHALRPLVPGRELVVAGCFGLIHGLAFAATLAGLGVDRTSLAIGVLGFNLGVEAMQLIVLALTVPWLLWLARYPFYRWLRIAAALVAGAAAIVWIVQRLSDG